MSEPRVTVVGIGEDGPAGLRPEALRAVDEASVLVGGERHLGFFPAHGAERIVFRRDLAALVETLRGRLLEGARVAVLASGDPTFFGIAPHLVAAFGPGCVRILPSIGSVPLAFARLGLAWEDATVLSAHGRALAPLVRDALSARKLAILTDPGQGPREVAAALLAAGMEPEARAWVLERLGGPDERIWSGALADVARWDGASLNVLVILRAADRVRGPRHRLSLPDAAYHHRDGQITKSEVRIVSLARLAPRPGDVVWDIGAGSGAVALEAADLCAPTGVVLAVERSPEQVDLFRRNVARHGVENVRLVPGEAPAALAELPAPDAVFIGGSGGALESILACALARLRPGGRIVANCALLESALTSVRVLEEHGLTADITQLAVSRGGRLSGGTHLTALNPVLVVSGERQP